MKFRDYLAPIGVWATLVIGFFYFVAFIVVGYAANLAVSAAFFSLSLSIKAYDNTRPRIGASCADKTTAS